MSGFLGGSSQRHDTHWLRLFDHPQKKLGNADYIPHVVCQGTLVLDNRIEIVILVKSTVTPPSCSYAAKGGVGESGKLVLSLEAVPGSECVVTIRYSGPHLGLTSRERHMPVTVTAATVAAVAAALSWGTMANTTASS